MEADWEIEIGPEAPIVDACWEGLVDLRVHPEMAGQLSEAAALPGLADALRRLNGSVSPFWTWTSKCDVWQIPEEDGIDPYEFDASVEEARYAWGCYIDLLPVSDQQWGHRWDPQNNTPLAAVAWCKTICSRLRSEPLRCCRVDLVIRKAAITVECMDIGITAYITACASDSVLAKQQLTCALRQFVDGFGARAKVE